MKWTSRIVWVVAILLPACNQPIKNIPLALHPENPHYFLYKNKPAILITSAEHYGAVLNLDFDFVAYLEELSSSGLNLTRTFTGAYLEPPGAFNIGRNTLAPPSESFICPWPRTTTPGYANGGNKFDLSKWDELYFTRLKDFVREAEKRDIIVELALFCPFYEDSQWNISPMNSNNNINSVGPTDRTHVYTLDKSNGLLEVQDKLVRKIIHELKNHNNLIYEICNEPYFGGVTMEWQHHIASLIAFEEKNFPNKHIISQNIANGKLKIVKPHPSISVFNFHYATPPVAVAQNYQLNRVIGNNETGFNGNADSTYRKEGWSFILAGGGLYNNLDYSFTSDHEDGSFQYPPTQPGGGSASLRIQLSHLRKFMDSFDYLRMKPDSTIVAGTAPKNFHVLAEEGLQYGIYAFGKGPISFDLSIPAGNYSLEFLDPITGKYEAKQNVSSDGKFNITTPAYLEDVGIRIFHERFSK
ncbi:MAG: cellulase family glycosylhydrolase [Cyclobacteriaceae bacterium]